MKVSQSSGSRVVGRELQKAELGKLVLFLTLAVRSEQSRCNEVRFLELVQITSEPAQ